MCLHSTASLDLDECTRHDTATRMTTLMMQSRPPKTVRSIALAQGTREAAAVRHTHILVLVRSGGKKLRATLTARSRNRRASAARRSQEHAPSPGGYFTVGDVEACGLEEHLMAETNAENARAFVGDAGSNERLNVTEGAASEHDDGTEPSGGCSVFGCVSVVFRLCFGCLRCRWTCGVPYPLKILVATVSASCK